MHVLLVAGLGAHARTVLEQQADADHDGHGPNGQQHHRATNEGRKQQKNNKKRQVDAGKQT